MSHIHLVALKDRPTIEGYLRRFPTEVSEMTFTNLFAWRKSRPVYYAEVQDALLFLVDSEVAGSSSKLVFGPVLGRLSPLQIQDALKVEVSGFVRIPEATADVLHRNGYVVEEDRDNADYVYRVEDLAELKGRRFHKKRNLIKQCLERFDATYVPVTADIVPECMSMKKRWCQARRCGQNPGLCREYVAVMECLSNWSNFPLMGGAIRIDGQIQAFALGEMLRRDTAVCHFEKAMPEYRGLGQLINQWFARYALEGFLFENREQDLGIPGLRQAKKSYHPDHMVDKFRAWLPGVDPSAVVPVEPHECAKHEKEVID